MANPTTPQDLLELERELDRAQARLKDFAGIAGDFYLELDANHHVTLATDYFCELVGQESDQVIGQPLSLLVESLLFGHGFETLLTQLDQAEPIWNHEFDMRLPTGQRSSIAVSAKPLLDDADRLIGYRLIGSSLVKIENFERGQAHRPLLRKLSETNRDFTESVGYAALIQSRLLPTKQRVDELLGKSAVLWQPKDQVGGDFYWVGEHAGQTYLVFFDCTGHGVPGALMTLIVTSVVEKALLSSPTAPSASKLIQKIHDGVCESMGITAEEPGRDGLECAVIRFSRFDDQLQFAGAGIDLFIVSETGQVERLRGARTTLGYTIRDSRLKVEMHRLSMSKDTFVLATDGLATQVGAETRRVWGTRRFIEALESAGAPAPAKIIRAVGRQLNLWQGDEARRDDVTLMAFRPSEGRDLAS